MFSISYVYACLEFIELKLLLLALVLKMTPASPPLSPSQQPAPTLDVAPPRCPCPRDDQWPFPPCI